MMFAMLFVFASVMAERGTPAAPIRGVSDACESATCVSPRQIIGTSEAVLMKRRLGAHTLIVDIHSATEPAARLPVPTDLEAAFVQSVGVTGLEFRTDFADKVDDALRAAHMAHDEPVIILSPSVERAVLAALLLQERGYCGILVMYDASRGRNDAGSTLETTGAARIPIA
jgi:hypothetical protein